ncbi:MAG TPA: hypothetical protein VMH35_08760 [Streptosporangiaceae bacterium]|nr:hypothetical protein [Streptosporangiaceae bacterium]
MLDTALDALDAAEAVGAARASDCWTDRGAAEALVRYTKAAATLASAAAATIDTPSLLAGFLGLE